MIVEPDWASFESEPGVPMTWQVFVDESIATLRRLRALNRVHLRESGVSNESEREYNARTEMMALALKKAQNLANQAQHLMFAIEYASSFSDDVAGSELIKQTLRTAQQFIPTTNTTKGTHDG